MEIEFERTLEDMIEFNLFHVDNSPSLRRQIFLTRVVLSLLVFLTVLLISYNFFHDRPLTSSDYIGGVLGGVFLFVLYPYINRYSYVRRLKKLYSEGDNKAILGKHKINVSKDDLMAVTPAGESKIKWSSINKIMKNEKFIFLYISAASAIMIPRKSFADRQMEDGFLKIVHQNTGK